MKPLLYTIIEDFTKELGALALKWWTVICWVILATVAKIAGKIQSGEKLTWYGVMVSAMLAFCFGMFAIKASSIAGLNTNAAGGFGILAAITSDKIFSMLISRWRSVWGIFVKIPPQQDDKQDA